MMAALARSAAPSQEPAAPAPAATLPRSLRTLPEQIAEHIYAAIVGGEYQPGERIREEALAESFGVSRGPFDFSAESDGSCLPGERGLARGLLQ